MTPPLGLDARYAAHASLVLEQAAVVETFGVSGGLVLAHPELPVVGPAERPEGPPGMPPITPSATTTAQRPELRFGADANDGLELQFAQGAPLRVREDGALGAPTTEGTAVTHARVGGRSYWTVATEHTGGFEEWLSIEGDRAYRDRAVARWEVQDASLREVPGTGAVQVLDGAGRPIAFVSAPRAWAGSGASVPARLAVEDGGIALYVDAGGEPVLVDPMWVPTDETNTPRSYFTQGSGLVAVPGGYLLMGGYDGTTNTTLATTESYSTTTNVWSPAASMATPRYGHSTTPLIGGRILVTGGDSGVAGTDPTAVTEIYDPVTSSWSTTAPMVNGRYYHTATRLADGRVLVAGGYIFVAGARIPTSTVEIYNPASGAWSTTGSLATPRYFHQAVLLATGHVLVFGGRDPTSPLASAELFDPIVGTWSRTGAMLDARFAHAVGLLADGTPLAIGGAASTSTLASTELYDTVTGTWSASGTLATARAYATATLLPNGDIIVAGGLNVAGATATALASSEVYNSFRGTFLDGTTLSAPRYYHAAIGIGPRQALAVGGETGTTTTTSTDIFTDDASVCGNGIVEPGETCDSGAIVGACCAADCTMFTCDANPVDAGTDAGTDAATDTDAGTDGGLDAGTSDAGRDAGSPTDGSRVDAGRRDSSVAGDAGADAGTTPPAPGGCGCTAAGTGSPRDSAAPLGLLGLAMLIAGRRQRRR